MDDLQYNSQNQMKQNILLFYEKQKAVNSESDRKT